MENGFKTQLGHDIFKEKYAQNQYETWPDRAAVIVDDVCGTRGGTDSPLMARDDLDYLRHCITEFKILPGGRYIYYAGRDPSTAFFNNCYLLRAEEDTRQEWGALVKRVMDCTMTGGGIGVDVSRIRPAGRTLSRTGGVSSGPLPLLYAINECGRQVMQGGSRRTAEYGSINWQHDDVWSFLRAKNWDEMHLGKQQEYTIADMKMLDFNYPAPLDMMNISINYDDAFLQHKGMPTLFIENCRQAMRNGEPGFSFNFGEKENETLRNACTEITSEDDSDVCNLASINLANIESAEEFKAVTRVASKMLVCGTIRAALPYRKVHEVRSKNRRLGLGLMGLHEWLLHRGHRYEINDELKQWLKIYRDESERSANVHCDRLFLSRPKGYRAIAPTGTISILAGTTSGIEPIYAVAYRRRYLTDGPRWKYQFVVDGTAQTLIDGGIKPDDIESAVDLAADPERRIKMQYEMQKYVDHGISSTINLPEWGTDLNHEGRVEEFAGMVYKYAPGLRGLTFYPSGARGGQPITSVPYEEAHGKRGVVYEDNSEEQCLTGVCGI